MPNIFSSFTVEKIELSSDPRILSFQAMRLGIFSLKQITHLMGIGSTVLRLKRQLNYWDENVRHFKMLNNYIKIINNKLHILVYINFSCVETNKQIYVCNKEL